MAQGEAALAEQPFGFRATEAGTQLGLPGHLVKSVQFVQAAQVQRHHRLEVPAHRVETPDHAGAAAERDDRDAVVGAEPECLGHLVFICREQHRIRCVLDTEVPASQQIEGRLAARPKQPAVVVDGDVRGADDRAQAVAIGSRQGRWPEPDLLGAGLFGTGPVDSERLAEQGSDAGGQGFGRCRVAPRVPLHRRIDGVGIGACHELQYYRSCQFVTLSRVSRNEFSTRLRPASSPSAWSVRR